MNTQEFHATVFDAWSKDIEPEDVALTLRSNHQLKVSVEQIRDMYRIMYEEMVEYFREQGTLGQDSGDW